MRDNGPKNIKIDKTYKSEDIDSDENESGEDVDELSERRPIFNREFHRCNLKLLALEKKGG